MTLREFLEVARRDFGIEAGYGPAAALASSLVKNSLVKKGTRSFVLLIEEDEVLSPSVLRSLCRFFRLPPEHFGLDPEPEED